MKPTLKPAQIAILEHLVEHGPQARQPLMKAAGVGHNTFAKLFESLYFKNLVIDGERQPGRSWCKIDITEAGRSALTDPGIYCQSDVVRTPSPVRCVAVPILPKQPYYRNNGNVHIPRFGQPC